jgi:hypothetical protein
LQHQDRTQTPGPGPSAHQAVTKHLTNNSPCCSDSSSGSYLLGLGARSCVPVHSSPFQDSSYCYYKQGLYRSNSRHRRLDRRCSFNHSTYTRREVPARTRSSRARFGYCASARKMVPPDRIHFEPPLEVLEVSCGIRSGLYEFAFHIMAFVYDHCHLTDPKAP